MKAIEQLAERECPCKCHEGTSNLEVHATEHDSLRKCSDCRGTGAAIPWARKKCQTCVAQKKRNEGERLTLIEAYQTTKHPEGCSGKGWLPNYDVRLEEVLAWWASNPAIQRLWWSRITGALDKCCPEDPASIRRAVFEAVEKAVPA